MLFGGIDWGDQALDFHLRTADGEVLVEGQVTPDVEGLADLFAALEAHRWPAEIGIAIETAHGVWVQALLDRGYRLYPVNPKTVDSFRKALSVAGNKFDKIDRQVLAMFLAAFHQNLRALPACLGRDAKRFRTAADGRALMGTAPVTRAGGKSRVVQFPCATAL